MREFLEKKRVPWFCGALIVTMKSTTDKICNTIVVSGCCILIVVVVDAFGNAIDFNGVTYRWSVRWESRMAAFWYHRIIFHRQQFVLQIIDQTDFELCVGCQYVARNGNGIKDRTLSDVCFLVAFVVKGVGSERVEDMIDRNIFVAQLIPTLIEGYLDGR